MSVINIVPPTYEHKVMNLKKLVPKIMILQGYSPNLTITYIYYPCQVIYNLRHSFDIYKPSRAQNTAYKVVIFVDKHALAALLHFMLELQKK